MTDNISVDTFRKVISLFEVSSRRDADGKPFHTAPGGKFEGANLGQKNVSRGVHDVSGDVKNTLGDRGGVWRDTPELP